MTTFTKHRPRLSLIASLWMAAGLWLLSCAFSSALAVSLPDTAVVITRPELALRDSGGVLANTAEFGTIDLGGYKTLHFTLANEGSATLDVRSVSLTGLDAADFALSPPSVTALTPGASTPRSITFVPGVEHKVSSASLVITSNDAYAPTKSWRLNATSGNRLLSMRVEEVGGAVVTSLSAPLDFGSPMLGETVTKTFRLTNLGSAPATDISLSMTNRGMQSGAWAMRPTADLAIFRHRADGCGTLNRKFNTSNQARAVRSL